MKIHILFATESMCGMCRQPGWHWAAVTPHRVLRWKGPFTSKAECLRSAANADPCAELTCWNSCQPNLELWTAGLLVRSKMVVGAETTPWPWRRDATSN
jgi:hypothetical protein